MYLKNSSFCLQESVYYTNKDNFVRLFQFCIFLCKTIICSVLTVVQTSFDFVKARKGTYSLASFPGNFSKRSGGFRISAGIDSLPVHSYES